MAEDGSNNAGEEFDELFGTCAHVRQFERVKNNYPCNELLVEVDDAEKLEEPAWERLGSYIAGNDYLRDLDLDHCRLDDSKIAAFFRGLTKSGSLRKVLLVQNTFGLRGIRSMTPFLKSSSKLTFLNFSGNGCINTECFNLLLESLDGGAIKHLDFDGCKIDSIAALGGINVPKLRHLDLTSNKITAIPSQALAKFANLEALYLMKNNIGEAGFNAIANLLRKEDCSLTNLNLGWTGMGDTEAKILAESLRGNSKLENLNMRENQVGPEGLAAFLTLLNDASSMERTANSNHTLKYLYFDKGEKCGKKAKEVAKHIQDALAINRNHRESLAAAGRAKVIKTLLNREKRMELSRLQGVAHSSDHYLFSGIDPILLPNVLELAVASGSQTELYQMLVAIAPDLVSLIDRKAMLQETLAKAEARLAAIAAEQAMLTAVSSRVKSQLISLEADEERVCQLSGKKRGWDTTNTT